MQPRFGGLVLPGVRVGIITILGRLIFFHYLPTLTFTSLLTNPAENLSILIWCGLTVGYRYSAVATRFTRSTRGCASDEPDCVERERQRRAKSRRTRFLRR